MAALMELDRLSGLFADAAAAGCRVAWLSGGALLTGPQLGQAVFAVDFANETLSKLDKVGAGHPSSDVAGPGRESSARALHGDQVSRRVDASPPSNGRRTGNFSLILEGRLYHARSQKELLRVALQAIEGARAGTLDKLSTEKGRTKRPVARRRELLYDDVKLSKFADEIEGGWWMATNNSYPEVEKFIRRAAWHAGLHVELRRSP